MRIWPALLCSMLALAAGCKDKASSGGSASGSVVEGDDLDEGAGAAARPDRPDPAAPVKEEATAFLARWVETQERRDFAAYAALYEPRTFRGIKRTSRGGVKKTHEYDLAGWKTDRARMFKRGFELEVELRGIETWLDPGSSLKPGVVALRFLQRWRGGKYADHGIKVLHVWRAPDGTMRITYEDLLNSEPGWARAARDVAVADLARPADDAAALALWRQLAPTGADYEDKLASIPDDDAVTRPLARVLLAGGNFACTEIVEYSACGDESVEWEDFNPAADLDDPCLRRRLALWALDEVHPDDLAGLVDVLVELARLDKPEDELPPAVASAVRAAPEAVRLAVYGALVAAGREAEVDIEGLSEAGLVTAAVEHGIDAAALALPRRRHVTVLAGLLNDKQMAVATREALLDRLAPVKDAKVTAALHAMTEDEDCALAMAAAVELERRKDRSRLPRRSPQQSAAEAEHAICMLLHDPDPLRAEARLAEFIGPDGVELIERIEDPWAEAEAAEHGDDDDGVGAEADDDDDPPRLTTLEEVLPHLQEVMGLLHGGWDQASLSLARGADGGHYISGFDFYRYNGCSC
jgi:hypothetical protein